MLYAVQQLGRAKRSDFAIPIGTQRIQSEAQGGGAQPNLGVASASMAEVHQLPDGVVTEPFDQLAMPVPLDADLTGEAKVGAVEPGQCCKRSFRAMDAFDHPAS